MSDLCQKQVYRGSEWHGRHEACGKPVKGRAADGRALCGVHLRAAIEADRKAAEDASWKGRVRELTEALGVRVQGESSSWGRGRFVLLAVEDAEAIAKHCPVPPEERDLVEAVLRWYRLRNDSGGEPDRELARIQAISEQYDRIDELAQRLLDVRTLAKLRAAEAGR